MVIAALLLMLIATSVFCTHYFFGQRWVNPVSLLNIPHSILLICYVIALRDGLVSLELSDSSLLMLAVGYASFVVGVFLAHQVLSPHASRFRAYSNLRYAIGSYELLNLRKVVCVSVAALFVCVATKLYVAISRYGDLFGNMLQIRKDYVFGDLNYGVANSAAFFLGYIVMLNLGILMGFRSKNLGKLIAGSILLVMLNDFTTGSAYWTFLALCLMGLGWLLSRYVAYPSANKKLPSLSVVIASLVPLFAIALLLYLRSEGKYGTTVSFSDLAVTYMGGNIASFSYFVDHPFPSEPPGRHVFGGLYGLINAFTSSLGTNILPENLSEDYWADIGVPWNTSIHFAYYYSDFGWIGVSVLSLVLGAISTMMFWATIRKPSLMRIQYCAMLLYVILVSVRNVPTEGQYFWVLLVVFPLLNQYPRRLLRLLFNRRTMSHV